MSKRFERMSKEEVVEVIRKAGGACSECVVTKKYCASAKGAIGCSGVVYKWLDEDIKTKMIHRYELIKSPEDVDRFSFEHDKMCKSHLCKECNLFKNDDVNADCFAEYLKEEIEVEE